MRDSPDLLYTFFLSLRSVIDLSHKPMSLDSDVILLVCATVVERHATTIKTRQTDYAQTERANVDGCTFCEPPVVERRIRTVFIFSTL